MQDEDSLRCLFLVQKNTIVSKTQTQKFFRNRCTTQQMCNGTKGAMNMNDLQVFANEEFGEIRTVTVEEEPWFVGRDVACALGYKNPQEAIRNHVDSEDKGVSKILTPGGMQQVPIINESGLYSLILSSKLPTAKKFKRWVTSEVLPSIRKHGGYIAGQEQMSDLELVSRALLITQRIIESKDAEIKSLEPDANMARDLMMYDGLHTLKEVADLVEKGRTELCTLLRTENVLSKQTGYNLPLNKYLKRGYFKAKIAEDSKRPVTLVTAKGLRFIYRLIKKYDLTDDFDTQALLAAADAVEVTAA